MIAGRLYSLIIRNLLRLVCRIDSDELKRIPASGPLILIINHINFLEVPIIYTFLHPRQIIGLVKKETWDIPVLGTLARAWGAIPVNRSGPDLGALRHAGNALKAGKILAIAPEGTRSGTGKLQRGHPGVALIAAHTGATIIPVAHWGGEKFWYNLKHLRPTRIKMRVGKPFRLLVDPGHLVRPVRRELTEEIMHQLALLLPGEYQGFYAQPQGSVPAPSAHLEFLD